MKMASLTILLVFKTLTFSNLQCVDPMKCFQVTIPDRHGRSNTFTISTLIVGSWLTGGQYCKYWLISNICFPISNAYKLGTSSRC